MSESGVRMMYETHTLMAEFGTVRLEEWPEGLVLWVGGEIRWKSWKDASFAATRLSERKRETDDAVALCVALNQLLNGGSAPP